MEVGPSARSRNVHVAPADSPNHAEMRRGSLCHFYGRLLLTNRSLAHSSRRSRLLSRLAMARIRPLADLAVDACAFVRCSCRADSLVSGADLLDGALSASYAEDGMWRLRPLQMTGLFRKRLTSGWSGRER